MVSIVEGMFGLGCWQAQGQMLRVVVTDAGKLFDVGVGVIVCWSLVIVDVDVPVEVIVAATTIFWVVDGVISVVDVDVATVSGIVGTFVDVVNWAVAAALDVASAGVKGNVDVISSIGLVAVMSWTEQVVVMFWTQQEVPKVWKKQVDDVGCMFAVATLGVVGTDISVLSEIMCVSKDDSIVADIELWFVEMCVVVEVWVLVLHIVLVGVTEMKRQQHMNLSK